MKIWRRKHIIVIAALAVLLLFASGALAVDNMNQLNQEMNKQTEAPAGHSVVWDFVKLVLVLAVIVGAAWSIVRVFGHKASVRMQGTWLHTVDEVMLGQNRGLVLCEVAGKLYAIGVTDHNINLLFEVDNPQVLKEISEGNYHQIQQSQDVMKDAADRVKGLFKPRKAASPPNPKDFHSLMAEQSKRLSSIYAARIPAGKVNKENDKQD